MVSLLLSLSTAAQNAPPHDAVALASEVKAKWLSAPDEAEAAGLQALAILAETPDAGTHALVAGYLPRIYIDRGQFVQAQSVLDSYFNLPAPSPDLSDHARALSNQGIVYKVTGNYLMAENVYLKAAGAYKTLNKTAALGNIYNNLALVSQSRGLLGDALTYYQKAVPLLEESGQSANLANLYSNIATISSLMGNLQSAQSYLAEAEKLILQAKDARKHAEFLLKKAGILAENNLPTQAKAIAFEGLVLAEQHDYADIIIHAYVALGNIAESQEQATDARKYYLQAKKLAGDTGASALQNRAVLLLANLDIAQGHFAEIQAPLEAILEQAKHAGQSEAVSDARALLVEVYLGLGDYRKAFTLEQARYNSLSDKVRSESEQRKEQIAALMEQKEGLRQLVALQTSHAENLRTLAQERQQRVMLALALGGVSALLLITAIFMHHRRKLAALQATMAQSMIEKKNQLLSDISHELRTPLTAIKIQTEMLEHALLDNPNTAYETIHEKIASLNRLINDVYQLSLADADALEMTIVPLTIADFIDQCAQYNRDVVIRSGLQFTLDNRLAASSKVMADKDRLTQVFVNLFSNSCRYTDKPGQVKIRAFSKDNLAIIKVEDSGPGLTDTQLAQLFERLYRADKSRSRALGGAGLGLAICKAFIQAQGGTIAAAHSALGGLKITITLPLTDER